MVVVDLRPPDPTLVTALTGQLADVLMRPAAEALSESQCARVRRVVERHISAGRIDRARALVSDEVTLACLQREITRHLYGECHLCPDLQAHCGTLDHMEGREERLQHQIAANGGL